MKHAHHFFSLKSLKLALGMRQIDVQRVWEPLTKNEEALATFCNKNLKTIITLMLKGMFCYL